MIRLRILGIDPGLATVGFSVVDTDKTKMRLVTCGVISTPAHTSLSSRLDRIFCDMNELISTFSPDVMSVEEQFHPEAMAVEELFFNTNITTGISVAHARGVILLAAYRAGVAVFEYTPLQVKQAVVGYGRAEKNQVIDMVRRILNLPSAPKPDDAADAVALAICHARSSTSLLSRKENEGICSTI